MRLIHSTELLIRRMRWKAYFVLNPTKNVERKESYGFKSHRSMAELQSFEEKMR